MASTIAIANIKKRKSETSLDALQAGGVAAAGAVPLPAAGIFGGGGGGGGGGGAVVGGGDVSAAAAAVLAAEAAGGGHLAAAAAQRFFLAAQHAEAVEAATVMASTELCTIVMDDAVHREIWTLFDMLDQDKSGTITLGDFVSLGERAHGVVSPQYSALVRQFDANGDGVITRAEWLQAFRKLMVDFPGGASMDEIVKAHLAPGQVAVTVGLCSLSGSLHVLPGSVFEPFWRITVRWLSASCSAPVVDLSFHAHVSPLFSAVSLSPRGPSVCLCGRVDICR
jgi:hypothetical protein